MKVVCGLIRLNSKLLLAQRPEHKKHGLLWEFPGGKVENGESLFDALTRELQEELKITTSKNSMNLIGSIKFESLELCLIGLHLNSLFSPQEHRAVAWVDFDSLKSFNLCPSDRAAIKKFDQDIRALFLE